MADTKRARGRAGIALAASLVGLSGLTACTGETPKVDPAKQLTDVKLAAYTSCEDALSGLKAAAKPRVGPYGFMTESELQRQGAGDVAAPLDGGGRGDAQAGAPGREKGLAAPAAPNAGQPAPAPTGGASQPHSGTNTHEKGVDEPDMIKTDGKRIITVSRGRLKVVDAASRQVTGTLELGGSTGNSNPADLLLHGDRALVIMKPSNVYPMPSGPISPAVPPKYTDDAKRIAGPQLVLVELAATPKIAGKLTVDGAYLDARQVGGTVRVVTHSWPRLKFPKPAPGQSRDDGVAANHKTLEAATADDLLPRWETETADGTRNQGRVDCGSVSHPVTYTAQSMLTLHTFNLGTSALGAGDPTSIVADGRTVYATEDNLYVANSVTGGTQLFAFETKGSGKAKHVASGAVPGSLLNQYSMSEHDGHLRVATTTGQARANIRPSTPVSESAVYVIKRDGNKLVETGRVGGLGKNERIYAVRFVGTTGYVVTFRQTDPLYTLDLRDPKQPKVVGELKINGYSAYLHPAGDGKLIGVGQDATDQGRRTGLQVSLFDVKDPAKPTRVANYTVPGANSEAEFDPHAFLYWPANGTIVLPVMTQPQLRAPGRPASPGAPAVAPERIRPTSVALVLRLSGAAYTEVGKISHTDAAGDDVGLTDARVRRSVVIGQQLWTLSDRALKVNDLNTTGEIARIAL